MGRFPSCRSCEGGGHNLDGSISRRGRGGVPSATVRVQQGVVGTAEGGGAAVVGQQRGSVRRHAVDTGQAIRGGMARKHSGGMRPGARHRHLRAGCSAPGFFLGKGE
ncbi:unnamed protein product [Ectocarpus sp. 12 AP-2014]